MSEMKTEENYPFLRIVRPDGEKTYLNEQDAAPSLSSIRGRIKHIETLDTVTSITEKYIASKFWRFVWFIFWLFVFFPMLILWYFMAEVRTRTLYKPARWFVRLEDGDGFYMESIFQPVIDFMQSEEQRLKFGFAMETPRENKPVKDPWS